MPETEEQKYIRSLREDLALLCCAGAYILEADIWPEFSEWLARASSRHEDLVPPSRHMRHVLQRTDRLIMLTHALDCPDDISELDK